MSADHSIEFVEQFPLLDRKQSILNDDHHLNEINDSKVDKHERDRQAKLLDMKRSAEESKDETRIYDIASRDRKAMASGTWIESQQLVKLTQMRGNFWRNYGFSKEGDVIIL